MTAAFTIRQGLFASFFLCIAFAGVCAFLVGDSGPPLGVRTLETQRRSTTGSMPTGGLSSRSSGQINTLRRAPRQAPRRAALILSGLMHGHKSRQNMADTCHGVYNCSKLIQLSARSIHKQLFQYNLDRHGIVFDTFLVSSNPEEFGEFARIYYSAKLTDFEVYLHCPEQQNQVMCSFWRGLRLKNQVEQAGGFRYEWVIIMRPDIYFFRPFDLGELNKDLFYVANWCHATGKPIVEDEWPVGAVGCRTLQTHSLDRFGIPDFWFAASSANMDAVFGHRPVYPKGPAGSGLHGFILNVIQFNGMGLRIGRYLYHHLDYDYWRHIVKYNRLDAFENGVWWHKPRPVKNLADKNVTGATLEVLATSHYQPILSTSLETSRWSRCAVPRAFCFASTDEMKSAPYAVPWGAGYQETHKQKNPLYPSIGFPSIPWSIDSLDKVRCKTEQD